jgi:hypothetical protein
MMAKSPADRFASMSEVAAVLEGLRGKDADIPFTHTSTLGRLKTWSTGIFSNLVRPGAPRKAQGGTSSESILDPNTPTLINPQ